MVMTSCGMDTLIILLVQCVAAMGFNNEEKGAEKTIHCYQGRGRRALVCGPIEPIKMLRSQERERENKDEWVFNGVKEAGASGMLI